MAVSEKLYGGDLRPERVFLILGFFFGLIFLFLTPPFQVPDEGTHFYRAYHLADGNLRRIEKEGRWGLIVPDSLIQAESAFVHLRSHPEQKVTKQEIISELQKPLEAHKTSFLQKDSFSPVPYFPTSLGVLLGKWANASPLTLMYLGRLLNLFTWIFLVFLSLRLIPIFKWVLCLLALAPMAVFEGASLSYDAFTNGICFVWIALVFYTVGRTERVTRNWFLLLLLVSLILTLAKHVYVFLFLLFLLIPNEKFASHHSRWMQFSLIAVLNLLISLLWFQNYLDLRPIGVLHSPPQAQWMEVSSDPIKYLATVAKTALRQGSDLFRQFFGVLGWLDTPLPGWFYPCYLCVLLWMAICEKSLDFALFIRQKALLVLSFTLSAVLVFLSMYLTHSPVASNRVLGVQGRYFIPIAPLLFFLFYNRLVQPPALNPLRIMPGVALCASSLAGFVAVYSLWQRYYGI